MKYETYLNNRILFESRILDEDNFGYSYIDRMLHGIRNKKLFFSLYTYDSNNIWVHQNVSSIDKHTRYTTFKKDFIGSKIRITDYHRNLSRFEKYKDYEKVLEKLKI